MFESMSLEGFKKNYVFFLGVGGPLFWKKNAIYLLIA